jgi:tetratricopeptide (TPR) repeat protein
MVVFVLLVMGVSVFSGYRTGLENKRLAQTQSIAQLGQEQFDLGVEDFLAGRYELASQRFEYVLSLNPTNPEAFELLSRALEALNQPTPTAIPAASPTPTETPDLGSYEGIFQSAQTAFNRGDWGGALDMLIILRGEDPNYRLAEVNQMMAIALRNRGMDKLFQGKLELGIYDLSLAGRFGPLDNQALSWRRSAEFHLLANSYYGLDWALAADYFGQICVADIWSACRKYAQSAHEYADLLFKDDDYCLASFYYQESLNHLEDAALAPTATFVGDLCLTATAPTPTVTTTPGTVTPTGTLLITPSPTVTFLAASPTATFSLTPEGTASSTPTLTATSQTATSTATATVTVTPTITETSTPITEMPEG